MAVPPCLMRPGASAVRPRRLLSTTARAFLPHPSPPMRLPLLCSSSFSGAADPPLLEDINTTTLTKKDAEDSSLLPLSSEPPLISPLDSPPPYLEEEGTSLTWILNEQVEHLSGEIREICAKISRKQSEWMSAADIAEKAVILKSIDVLNDNLTGLYATRHDLMMACIAASVPAPGKNNFTSRDH